MQKLLDASHAIATLDPLQATENIVTETRRILACDRATIFTMDKATNELVLHVAEGAKDIRVPVGQGIAGTVASTGETVIGSFDGMNLVYYIIYLYKYIPFLRLICLLYYYTYFSIL